MQTLADILRSVFQMGRCDFCEQDGLTYTDPETGCLYCLECLEGATEPLEDTEGDPDPAFMETAREIIAARRLAA